MKDNKEVKTIIEHRKLSVRDSLINSIPCLIGSIIWVTISRIGFETIKNSFTNDGFKPIALLIWLVIMINLTKLISVPTFSYNVEREVVEE